MRRFAPIFSLTDGGSMTRLAVAAVREGYAIIPVKPGGKIPLCTLNSRELSKAGKDHPCGVHHAITTDKDARRIFTRLGKTYERLNIGIVAHPSRLVIVDCDQASEVKALQRDWADATGDDQWLDRSPTVRTPGLQDEAGNWLHSDGGHYYFELPEGVDLPSSPGVLKADGGYDIKWGWTQAVAPPSERPEGRYTAYGNVVTCPAWILDLIRQRTSEAIERRQRSEAFSGDVGDPIAVWSQRTSWSELLGEDGWTDTGDQDRCGCSIWTKPGGGSTSPKSATAHENICDQYPNAEGHGPLHLWTTDPPAALSVYAGKTLTKLQYVAAVRHAGDESAATAVLNLGADVADWVESLTADADGQTPVSEKPSVEGGHADSTPSDKGLHDSEVQETAVSEAESLTADEGDENPLMIAADKALEAVGLPPSVKPELILSVKKRKLADATDHMLRSLDAGSASSWLPPEGFIEDFINGTADDVPTVLPRPDGKGLFYPGRVNTVVGRRAAGKTWLAGATCMSVLATGGRALYYDMEDTAEAFKSRFETAGFDIITAVKDERLVWIKPGGLPADEISQVIEYAQGFDLVVFDVMNRLITRAGGNPDAGNKEVSLLYDTLFDPIADNGSCVLVLDHPNRSGQHREATLQEMIPGGGALKMNHASGHVIVMKPLIAFSRERVGGDIELFSMKDRCGHYAEEECVGRLVGEIAADGQLFMDLSIKMPHDPDDLPDEDEMDIQKVMDRVTHLLAQQGASKAGTLQPNITQRLRPKWDWAIARLKRQGVITEEEGVYSLVTE